MQRVLVRLVVTWALVYVSLCAFIYLTQRNLIYFPDATRVTPDSANFELARGDITLRGWMLHADKTNAILYFGGNAERIELNRELFAHSLPEHAIYLLPYRGYGPNEGTLAEDRLCDDAIALFDAVRARHSVGAIGAIGRSLGSGVASCLAAQRPLDRLALITPFDSLVAVAQAHYPWLPVSWLMKDRYESALRLRDFKGSTLVVRAGQDEIIPSASTDALISALRQPADVVAFPEATHNNISDLPAYQQALAMFFQ